MILLTSVAAAQELLWDCPTVTVPADANSLRDTDGGLDAAWERVDAEVRRYTEQPCVWVETTDDGSYPISSESVCTAATYEATVTTTINSWTDGYFMYWDQSTVSEVSVALGEGWTRVRTVEWAEFGGGRYGEQRDTLVHRAEWEGVLADLPADGSLEVEEKVWRMYADASGRGRRGSTPECQLEWEWSNWFGAEYESVTTEERTISTQPMEDCPGVWAGVAQASVDDMFFGSVDPADWEPRGVDADGDGYGDLDDCQDADPTIHPCAAEVADDGTDQDCDGADKVTPPEDTAPPDTAGPEDTSSGDTSEPPSAAPPPSDARATGCIGTGANAALLVLVPLLGWTRRRGRLAVAHARGFQKPPR